MMESIGFNTYEDYNSIEIKIANSLIEATTIQIIHKSSKIEINRKGKKERSSLTDFRKMEGDLYMYSFNSKRKIQAPMEPFFNNEFFQAGWIHDILKSLCHTKHLEWLEKETKKSNDEDNGYGVMEASDFINHFQLKDSFTKRLSPKIKEIYSKYKMEKSEIEDIETDHNIF